jgi:protein-L-isoaspartate(D-aspartate) O-methyltransferase
MARVPREVFVEDEHRHLAFADEALPIGWGQTISQPSVVAATLEALAVEEGHRVLDVGTGSGFQAALLAELGARVVGIERNPRLAALARRACRLLGYDSVEVVEGDGSLGWPPGAPYDRIVVAAAAPAVPPPLLEQLAPHGRLVLPIGGRDGQQLVAVSRASDGTLRERSLGPVRFVPLIGAHAWPADQTPA